MKNNKKLVPHDKNVPHAPIISDKSTVVGDGNAQTLTDHSRSQKDFNTPIQDSKTLQKKYIPREKYVRASLSDKSIIIGDGNARALTDHNKSQKDFNTPIKDSKTLQKKYVPREKYAPRTPISNKSTIIGDGNARALIDHNRSQKDFNTPIKDSKTLQKKFVPREKYMPRAPISNKLIVVDNGNIRAFTDRNKSQGDFNTPIKDSKTLQKKFVPREKYEPRILIPNRLIVGDNGNAWTLTNLKKSQEDFNTPTKDSTTLQKKYLPREKYEPRTLISNRLSVRDNDNARTLNNPKKSQEDFNISTKDSKPLKKKFVPRYKYMPNAPLSDKLAVGDNSNARTLTNPKKSQEDFNTPTKDNKPFKKKFVPRYKYVPDALLSDELAVINQGNARVPTSRKRSQKDFNTPTKDSKTLQKKVRSRYKYTPRIPISNELTVVDNGNTWAWAITERNKNQEGFKPPIKGHKTLQKKLESKHVFFKINTVLPLYSSQKYLLLKKSKILQKKLKTRNFSIKIKSKLQSYFYRKYLLIKNIHSYPYQKYLLTKNVHNKLLKQVYKQRLTAYDKVFSYYQIKIPISLYCHKVFILLEIQLNTLLAKTKLVPYLFISEDICFYRLVWVNDVLVSSPYFLVGLYDTIRIPIHLYNYIYHQQHKNQYYPKIISNFFKNYWQYITNFSQNKVWLLNNYLISPITAEALIFDYPNLLLYQSPFTRFTKIYYRNKPNTPVHESFSTYTHVALKITLFNYISFYK